MDEELTKQIRRAQSGDHLALDSIVRRFQDRAAAYAYSLLRDRHAAEDAAQDALLQAYRDLPSLSDPAAFPSWLRAIVFKHAHRVMRRRKLPTVALERAPETASPTNGGDDMERMLRQAIGTLTPGERSVVVLHYLGGHSQLEVADFLGVPVTTVRKRMERARTRLKERMLDMVENALRDSAPSRDTRFAEMARLLRRIVDVLEADPNVAAAYLARFGPDEGLDTDNDGWNSLNLHIVLNDGEAMNRLATERRAFSA